MLDYLDKKIKNEDNINDKNNNYFKNRLEKRNKISKNAKYNMNQSRNLNSENGDINSINQNDSAENKKRLINEFIKDRNLITSLNNSPMTHEKMIKINSYQSKYRVENNNKNYNNT